jgi:hypothetical protein
MANVRPLREHYGPNEDLAFQRDLNTWHYSEIEYLRGVIRDVSNSPHIPPVERRILKESLTDSGAHEPSEQRTTRIWIALKGNEKALTLSEADGWEVHEVVKAPVYRANSPEDIKQSMDLLQQIHQESNAPEGSDSSVKWATESKRVEGNEMASRSAAKSAPWLEHQMSTARQNLSEWPAWMKATSRLDGVITPRNRTPSAELKAAVGARVAKKKAAAASRRKNRTR